MCGWLLLRRNGGGGGGDGWCRRWLELSKQRGVLRSYGTPGGAAVAVWDLGAGGAALSKDGQLSVDAPSGHCLTLTGATARDDAAAGVAAGCGGGGGGLAAAARSSSRVDLCCDNADELQVWSAAVAKVLADASARPAGSAADIGGGGGSVSRAGVLSLQLQPAEPGVGGGGGGGGGGGADPEPTIEELLVALDDTVPGKRMLTIYNEGVHWVPPVPAEAAAAAGGAGGAEGAGAAQADKVRQRYRLSADLLCCAEPEVDAEGGWHLAGSTCFGLRTADDDVCLLRLRASSQAQMVDWVTAINTSIALSAADATAAAGAAAAAVWGAAAAAVPRSSSPFLRPLLMRSGGLEEEALDDEDEEEEELLAASTAYPRVLEWYHARSPDGWQFVLPPLLGRQRCVKTVAGLNLGLLLIRASGTFVFVMWLVTINALAIVFLWNPDKAFPHPDDEPRQTAAAAAAAAAAAGGAGAAAAGGGQRRKRASGGAAAAAGKGSRGAAAAAAGGVADGGAVACADGGGAAADGGADEDGADGADGADESVLARGTSSDFENPNRMRFYDGAAHASIFNVRIGPNYKKNKQKAVRDRWMPLAPRASRAHRMPPASSPVPAP